MTSITCGPPRTSASGRRKPSARRTCSRWAWFVDVRPPDETTMTGSRGSSAASRRSSRRTSRRSRPATTSARRPSCSPRPTGGAARRRAGDLSQRRRIDRAGLGSDRGGASAAGSRCSTRAIRSPRPPSCSTSFAGTRTSASSRPGRGRDRGRQHGAGRGVRRAPRRHRDQRARAWTSRPRRSGWP